MAVLTPDLPPITTYSPFGETAMLYNPQTNQLWIRHQAFGKMLSLLPLGFMLSWIFFIPYISEVFGLIYDRIAIINSNSINRILNL